MRTEKKKNDKQVDQKDRQEGKGQTSRPKRQVKGN